jgi:IS5 family transposase
MQTPADKTGKMIFATTEEELFNSVIDSNHPFRIINNLLDFEALTEPMRACYSTLGANGIDVTRGVKALMIQFWENYSDREMEKAIKENLAIRWFCGFGLSEKTPDYSYFSKLRKRIGTKRIADLFKTINNVFESYGLFGNTFTFVDASSIITKTALWKERDEALADGEEKLNNAIVEKYAADKDARFGSKSKRIHWFGYKRHEAVDMRHGLVRKVAVTSAEILDFQAVKSVLPKVGAVLMDKGYDTIETDNALRARGLHAMTLRKNNNKKKNKDFDRWVSKRRMPFECSFSKVEKRARYRGRAKVTLQCFLEAIVHNMKKAIRYVSPEVLLLVQS